LSFSENNDEGEEKAEKAETTTLGNGAVKSLTAEEETERIEH
jgi:hypothetical protein